MDLSGHEAAVAIVTVGVSAVLYKLVLAAAILLVMAIVALVASIEKETHFISNTVDSLVNEIDNALEKEFKILNEAILGFVSSLVIKRDYKGDKEVPHIVARRDPRAVLPRLILEDCNIGIDSTENTVAMNKSYHKVLHTNLYYLLLNFSIFVGYFNGGEKGVRTVLKIYKEILGGL